MDVVVALFRFALAAFALIGTQEIWLHGQLDGLLFFTNQSGFMLAVVMVWGGIASLLKRRQPPAWFKGGVTLFLVITGLVAYFVLKPEAADAPQIAFGLTSGQIEHQIDPVLAFVDFLVFDAHRRMRGRYPAFWLLYLVAYVVFSTLRGVFFPDLTYPYGFIDRAALGWGGLGLNVLLYGLGFYALGWVVVGLDRLLPRHALVGSAGRHEGAGERWPVRV